MDPLFIAQTDKKDGSVPLGIRPEFINRHGCIFGATGTGKTVSLQMLAEQFSRIGVPVFMADVKGDLSGMAAAGQMTEKLKERLEEKGIPAPEFSSLPVTFWDVFGESGHPVRATISDMGPTLLASMLNLNDTQEGVLNAVFKFADDEKLLLLDLKDLKSMLNFASENSAKLKAQYGNISAASVGAITRALLRLENEGGDKFFGEPMLDVADLMQTVDGKGVINILSADKLINSPLLYSVFLLWLLSEIYEALPECGDLEKPKFVFFFDEAHLLFDNCSHVLIEKVEQVVRLIRSKGVGVYFISQSPNDIAEEVLGQLGNRIQHALRAYTPKDQKAVRSVGETMRPNPKLDLPQVILELGVGEALVSFLDEDGTPGVTQRAYIGTPGSRIGPLSADERKQVMQTSLVAGVYEQAVDRQSAYEVLDSLEKQHEAAEAQAKAQNQRSAIEEFLFGSTGPRGGHHDGLLESVAKSVVRTQTRRVVNKGLESIVRGIFGTLIGRR